MAATTATLIHGARVLDLDGDVDQPALADILIENGIIVAVGEAATARASQREDVARIDASGKLAIPGLVNAHYHSHDVMLRGLFEQIPLDVWSLYSSPANYARRSAAEVALRTTLGAAECLVNGITTMQDMVTVVGADQEHVEAIISAYAEIGVRVVLGLQIADRAAVDAVPFWRELPEAIRGRLPKAVDTSALRRQIETLSAGAAKPLLTWALAASAPQRSSDALLQWVARTSRERDLQVFTHLYEARSQAVLARLAYDQGSLLHRPEHFDLLSPRLTIAHGVWIADDEIKRFGAAGANLACNPMSNMKLLNGFAPVVEYVRLGAGVSLGCDNCSGNDVQSIFQSMKMFALLWGFQAGAGERDAARGAFKAATFGGARALGLEGKIGAIRPGYQADIVLIDLEAACYRPLNSALRQLVYAETGTGVHTVMVAGKVAVQDRRLTMASGADLKARAEAARATLEPEVREVVARNAELLKPLLEAHEKSDRYPLPFDRLRVR
jgi:cytosine/adenosine deaminase-related metal-dependent hydrolase